MTFEQNFFLRKIPDFQKLTVYGFKKQTDGYHFTKQLENSCFEARFNIKENGEINGGLFDTLTDDPYLVIYSNRAIGDFVARIREQYISLLSDISCSCFLPVPFVSPQANRITERIKAKLNVEPDHPFRNKAISSYGVFRHPESRSWFALVMYLKDNVPYPGFKAGEVINLRTSAEPSDAQTLSFVHPAYHMNKKTWITIPLNEEADDDLLIKLIKGSYQRSASKTKRQNRKLLQKAL